MDKIIRKSKMSKEDNKIGNKERNQITIPSSHSADEFNRFKRTYNPGF